MKVDENSLLVTTSPTYLVIGFIMCIVIGFISSYIYRNTNDFKKASKLQLILSSILVIIMFFLDVQIMLLIGMLICSFIFTATFSNYFFYKR